jgi:aspartate-semialdehyde dehydrogenase
LVSRTISKAKPYRVAIVGSDTLLGRELEEVIKARSSGVVLSPYAANAEGSFRNQADEAVYVNALSAENIVTEDAVVLAGTEDGASKAYQLAESAPRPPILIDCTGFLERKATAHIVMPLSCDVETGMTRLFVLPHAAAAASALVLIRLARKARLRQAVIHVFEPASELGKGGINELHQQTTSLLAFKPLEKKVFDTQLSFNMLAQYGEEAAANLLSSEQRITRDIASVLNNSRKTGTVSGAPASQSSIPMPSVRLLQAPVFHGYSISFWVEFEAPVDAATVAEALASAQIEIRTADQEPPTNVGAVGQSGLIAGDIRIDENNPRAVWIWAVADNLRLIADGVADLLSEIRKPVQ